MTAAERFEAALALLPEDAARAGERGWLCYRLGSLRRFGDQHLGLAALDEAARLATLTGDQALAAATLVQRGWLLMTLGDAQGLPTLEAGVAAIDALPPAERARLNRLDTLSSEDSDLNLHRGTLIFLRTFHHARFPEMLAESERFVAQAPAPTTGRGVSAAFAGYFGGAYYALGTAHATMGRPGEAARAFAEARAAYRAIGDDWMLGEVAKRELEVVALTYAPERIAARRRLGVEIAERFGRASAMGLGDSRLHCLPLLVLEGHWAEARALAAAGSTATSLAGGRFWAGLWLAWLAREQGEWDLAWAQLRAVQPTDPAAGAKLPAAPWTPRVGDALALATGNLPAACAWLEAHDRWLAWSGAVLGLAEGQLGWAAYHRAAGDLARAREHADRALALAAEPRQPLAILAARRLLGELDTAAGQHGEAAAHLDAALLLAEACAAPYQHALTLLATAERHAAAGRREAAQAGLARARSLLEPLAARPALARADTLAKRLAAAPVRALPFGLTPREAEVLALVAEGLTDAQIAARLFVSRNTVAYHTKAIYGKLSVNTRAAATRLAAEHGLA